MSVTVTFELPADLEQRLRAEHSTLDADVKEAYLIALFRRGTLSHYELSQALGLDRFETDAYLKRHQIFEGSPTMEDLDSDLQTLERLIPKDRA